MSYLIVFSYLGVALRIALIHAFGFTLPADAPARRGINALDICAGIADNTPSNAGDVLYPEFFANCAGCFIMGLLFMMAELIAYLMSYEWPLTVPTTRLEQTLYER